MLEQLVPITQAVLGGLRPMSKTIRNEQHLTRCQGAYPFEGSLVQVTDVQTINYGGRTFSFPYPQIFTLSQRTIVCGPSTIYEYVNEQLTVVMDGLESEGLWSVADFGDFLLLTNGKESIFRSPETGTYQSTQDFNQPPAEYVLGTGSQVIWGGPDLSLLGLSMSTNTDIAPPAVQNVYYVNASGTVTLYWSMPTTPADLAGYRVRYAPGVGVIWSQMQAAHVNLIPKDTFSFTYVVPTSGLITLAIVAEDSAGNQSEPVYVELLCVVRDYKALNWPGVLTDLVKSNTCLYAGSVMTWENLATSNYTWAQWTDWSTGLVNVGAFTTDVLNLGGALTFTPKVTNTGTGKFTTYVSYSLNNIDYTAWSDTLGEITAQFLKLRIVAENEGSGIELVQTVLTI